MAWKFVDTNTDDVQITDNAALTLPAADWAIGGWFRIADNSGSFYHYLLAWGIFGESQSCFIHVGETSVSTFNDKISWVQNGSGPTNTCTSTATPGADTNWHHVLVQRSGSTTTLYVDGVAQADTITGRTTNVADAMGFGSRISNPTNRYLEGDLAEWASWDRALDLGEIRALVNGERAGKFPKNLKWYLRMKYGGTGGDYKDYGPNRLTVTNNGSDYADRHGPPTLWTPQRRVVAVPAPPAGLDIPIAMHHYKQLMGAA